MDDLGKAKGHQHSFLCPYAALAPVFPLAATRGAWMWLLQQPIRSHCLPKRSREPANFGAAFQGHEAGQVTKELHRGEEI